MANTDGVMKANSPKLRLANSREITCSSVVIPEILNKSMGKKAFLLLAGIYAGLYLLNMQNPEPQQALILVQLIWSLGLGIMYTYIFVKFRTIIPFIILIYIINALITVWFGDLVARTLIEGVFGIPFFGLLPAGAAFL